MVDHYVGTMRYMVTIVERSQLVIRCSKLTKETLEQVVKHDNKDTSGVVLVSLLTLNIFHTLFCFYI